LEPNEKPTNQRRKRKMTTYQGAKALLKEKAPGKYRGTKLLLLQKMTNSLYNPNDDSGDVEKRMVSKKVTTVCGWVGITDRQLRAVLPEIEEVTIVSRNPGTITYTLNFEPLKSAEKQGDKKKRQQREQNAKRTTKARAKRADIRRAKELGRDILVRGFRAQQNVIKVLLDDARLSPEEKEELNRRVRANEMEDTQ
jgi:hypothetical protein